MLRRQFLRAATAAGVAVPAALGPGGQAPRLAAADPLPPLGPPPEVVRNGMRYRPLGKTGAEVSAIGLGGHHIGRQKEDAESVALIRAAIDGGITFLDNCWDYHDGVSEERMGLALRDGYRDRVFLMTKIDGRTKKAAAQQIDQSLRRLRTDRVDLLQIHEVIRLEDPDRVFADGGTMEAVLAAKKAGKVRFVGFTGHKDPLVHLRMLDVAAAHGFHFDAAQMPLNVMDAHFRSFARQVVPRLVAEGIGVLGMKAFADGAILNSKTASPAECLRYALSLPTAVVITGIDTPAILKQALDAARDFKPLTPEEATELLSRTAKAAATGRYEKFKTGNQFDSTAKNPKYLGDEAGGG